ncbi:MAG: thermonuclease family protein [Saprospiraceae bacterium]
MVFRQTNTLPKISNMSRLFFKTYLSLTFVTFLTGMARLPSLTGKCVGIADGDTITVLDASNQQHKIRLAHIDCPERKQAFSQEAKSFTSDFCFGKTVQIVHFGKRDRIGRIIGIVYDNQGRELNSAHSTGWLSVALQKTFR